MTVKMSFAREPLPKVTAIQLFKSLFLARRSEEYIVKHYPENQMRTPMHMSMGQEFVPVGVCAALDGKADVFASYRSHAPFLAPTHDPAPSFSDLYGRTSGTGEGKGGSMHLAAPDQGHMLSSGVVATQIPVAAGAAFANTRTGRFVCEDNDYAVDTPREARQASRSLGEAVKPFGADTYEDDSGDVESVYSLAKEAAEKAHRDRRPAFLNIKCCRYLEHVGIGTDWNWGYRDQATVERDWIARDALKAQPARLASHQMGESAIAAVEEEIDKSIRASVQRAMEAPIPAPDRLHAGVFHEKA